MIIYWCLPLTLVICSRLFFLVNCIPTISDILQTTAIFGHNTDGGLHSRKLLLNWQLAINQNIF